MGYVVKKIIIFAGGYVLGELATRGIKKIMDKIEEKQKVNDSEEE